MNLPFTREQFFEVFAAYNTAVWPAQFVLVLIAIALLVVIFRTPARAGRIVSYGLALLWTWLGLAYHLTFFREINPAAPVFAAISLASAAALAWFGGAKGGLRFEAGMSGRTVLGMIVVMYALVIYPAIGALLGHHYPATPTFGLPCPTTIFTFGLLLMAAPGSSKALLIGPIIWAAIGANAAFALGVMQDLGLVVVAVIGLYLLIRRTPRGDIAQG